MTRALVSLLLATVLTGCGFFVRVVGRSIAAPPPQKREQHAEPQ
jgi:hypothetical protein